MDQSPTVGGRCGREAGNVVAPLEHTDQPASGVSIGDVDQHVGEFGEVRIGETEVSQRVSESRVEAS